MRRAVSLLLPLLAHAVASAVLAAPATREAPPTIAAKTSGLEARPGLLVTYLDRDAGKLWLELPSPGPRGIVGEYLYVEGLLTGLGPAFLEEKHAVHAPGPHGPEGFPHLPGHDDLRHAAMAAVGHHAEADARDLEPRPAEGHVLHPPIIVPGAALLVPQSGSRVGASYGSSRDPRRH